MSTQLAHFTVAYWCVLVAVLLPIGCAMLAKRGGFSMKRDNHDPRQWLTKQTGWRARANAAQANSYESLPFFIGAVIIAHQLGAAQTPLDMLALAYVLIRLLYIVMYVGDLPTARSMIWGAGFLVNVGILFLGYR
ncbi:MAPEG family protein [Diaphorobacter aerolatus]|uniref:MAPEG family protein n=1 Tax=Diaphorobacter aerolatus TaxID=1288495 RepID=A0A7H0GLN1_9BURK|nr:MAPEG family protein [Diaphorobacter aerolatus]QNP49197.1 MAPEG family protein [Diaphorobacter aerolatus]